MHALTAWFIPNPVAANLLMALILFLRVQGVHSITSQSGNGYAHAFVRRAGGAKLQAGLDWVRIRIYGMTDLPDKMRRDGAEVLIYVKIAVPLKSYWQPLAIPAIVPFGFIAASVGHLIMGASLSLFSFFGMLALTGVVVNDSMVMIICYNQARNEGETAPESLHDAGIGRFQAIFLTTATTVISLLLLLTETSEQAQYLIPAAVSLAFGELFGTAVMLLLVPALIAIAKDILGLLRPTPNPFCRTRPNHENLCCTIHLRGNRFPKLCKPKG